MSFDTGFRGQRGSAGAVQTSVKDQPGIGIPGMIAFASDNRQIDSILIGETNGVAAGRGVKFTAITQAAPDLQTPPFAAYLPESGDVIADFAGILVFNESIQSDENGVPGWANGRLGRILQPHRAGGRIHVLAKEAIAIGDSVNWVIVAPVDESYELGEFSPSALGGGAAGTSLAISTSVAKWIRGSIEGETAILEFLGTYEAPIET